MPRSQPGPSASASAGSLSIKRHLSPDMMSAAHGNTIPAKPVLRRPTKRNRSTPEAQQPTRPMQSTTRPTPNSPGKLSKGRAISAASERTPETGGPIQPGMYQPMIIPQKDETPHSPIFSGNFDLYGMYLPSLAKVFLPPGATTPDYSAVYDRILTSQARHDYTARCFLSPQETATSPPLHGRFESSSVLNPMAGLPFDITLDSFTYKKLLTFTTTERTSFHAPECSVPGPGLVGHTRLSPACGIKDARGVFKIKRVWATEQGGSVKELFEGFFSFSVCYDSMNRKMDHSNGAKYKFAFWGVRAMKDNTGKEIGLELRKTAW